MYCNRSIFFKLVKPKQAFKFLFSALFQSYQYCDGDDDSDDEVNEESWCTCLSSHEVRRRSKKTSRVQTLTHMLYTHNM